MFAQTGEVIRPCPGRCAFPRAFRRRWKAASRCGGARIDQTGQVGLPVTPGAQQAERVARLHRQARQVQPAALGGRQAQRGARALVRRHVRRSVRLARVPARRAQPDRGAFKILLVHQQQIKRGQFAGEHRFGLERAQSQMHLIAKGVQHRHQAGRSKKKRQHKAERQVVVDRAGQHRQQRDAKEKAIARRENEHTALMQKDIAAFRPARLEDPVVDHREAEHPVHRGAGHDDQRVRWVCWTGGAGPGASTLRAGGCAAAAG